IQDSPQVTLIGDGRLKPSKLLGTQGDGGRFALHPAGPLLKPKIATLQEHLFTCKMAAKVDDIFLSHVVAYIENIALFSPRAGDLQSHFLNFSFIRSPGSPSE